MRYLFDPLTHKPKSSLFYGQWHTITSVVALCSRQNSTFHHIQCLHYVASAQRPHQKDSAASPKSGLHGARLILFFLSSSITVVGLIFKTRAMSRTPLPFRLISMICSLTSGNRPNSEYSRINVFPEQVLLRQI